MAIATRLKKLEQKAQEAQDIKNREFLSKVIDYLIDLPVDYQHAKRYQDLSVQIQNMTGQESKAIQALYDTEAQALFKLLNFEGEMWVKWAKEMDAIERDTPYLAPHGFPLPPCDPAEALQVIHGLEYPLDFVGMARWDFAFRLAFAKFIWDSKPVG